VIKGYRIKPFVYMAFQKSLALGRQVFELLFVHISDVSTIEFTSLCIGANEVDASP